MTEIAQAEEKLRELRAKIESDDVDGAKACVTQLKMLMLSFPAGPDAPERCAGVAAETLESAALLSLREGDLAAFARNVSQVRPYYDAASSSSSNNNRARILGLNLMYLLTENRLSEFHAELELLTETEAADPLVTFPIALERQLMVGSYDEVLDAGARAPDPSYDFFFGESEPHGARQHRGLPRGGLQDHVHVGRESDDEVRHDRGADRVRGGLSGRLDLGERRAVLPTARGGEQGGRHSEPTAHQAGAQLRDGAGENRVTTSDETKS